MRKNRSNLRKNFAQPIQDKRQEKIAKAIQEQVKERSGSTIKALKSVLGASTVNLKPKPAMEVVEDSNGVVAEDQKSKKTELVKARVQVIKRKGSKPRENPTKKLEWF